jgi:hypothetical protein
MRYGYRPYIAVILQPTLYLTGLLEYFVVYPLTFGSLDYTCVLHVCFHGKLYVWFNVYMSLLFLVTA